MISRRRFIQGLAATLAVGGALGSYAFGIEPRWRLVTTRYRLTPPNWPPGLSLKVAVIADLHAGEPYMPLERIAEIVERTNALGADVIVLIGDYAAAHRFQTRRIAADAWARALAGCKASLGVHAILGNHDWWDDADAQRLKCGPVAGRRALERAGIPVYENDVVRLEKDGRAFWLAGLGDQIAFKVGWSGRRMLFEGVDDLAGTLAKVTDDAPVILLAHEPDIFPEVSGRVSLTIAGHTHGGQVRLFGYSPVVPSQYGNRYAYGHVIEDAAGLASDGGKHLIVSEGSAARSCRSDLAARRRSSWSRWPADHIVALITVASFQCRRHSTSAQRSI